MRMQGPGQMLMAKFEYEVRSGTVSLYDRVDIENGLDTLRFLAQVPIEADLERCVRSAVEKLYTEIGAPVGMMRVQAKDMHSERTTIDYVRG